MPKANSPVNKKSMTRKQKTTFDYMVIGISPALVTVMVTSLALFISTILNPSPFLARFNFVLMMYSMATVAIARISIEEGKERAVLFGVPLAAATLLAMTSLVQYEDAVGGMKFIYSAVVIAVTWWSAHQLTWDCTVIEDHDDSSNQGLLQKIGLEEFITKVDESNHSSAPVDNNPELDSADDEDKQGWFDRWKENRKKPHTPGVWVIYYSLAALPLFGLGQLFTNAEVNSICFKYLFSYVASGLGLLLTTSLLGLRRYLRHRNVDMPHEMAGTWLTVGIVMILGFMALAFLLPRPGNTRQIAEASSLFDQSQDAFDTSEYGVGSDGKADGNEGQSPEEVTQDSGSSNDEKNSPSDGQDKQSNEASQSNQDNNDGEENTEDSAGQSREQTQENQNSDMSSGNQQDSQNGQSDDPQQSGNSNNQTAEQNGSQKDSNSEAPDSADPGEGQEQERPSEQNGSNPPNSDSERAQQSSQNSSRQNNSPPLSMPNIPSLGAIGRLIQILFWIVVGISLLLYLLKNYRTLWKALQEIISGFLEWLSGVFAGTAPEQLVVKEKPAKLPEPSPQPFSSFRNPFNSNSQMSVEELINYSFNALESLGQELGIEREENQTPNEFSQAMAQHITPLGEATLRLGNHYNLAAYAPASLSPSCVQDLQTFWQQLSLVEIPHSSPVNVSISD